VIKMIVPSNFRLNQLAIKKLDFPKLARTLLQDTQAIILRGLSKGSGPNGSLRMYSDSYQKAIAAGWIAGKVDANTVNLRATGQMLNSMQNRETQKGAELYFGSGRTTRSARLKTKRDSNVQAKPRKANRSTNAEIAAGNEARGREFFGFGKEEQIRIEKQITLAIDRILKSL